MNRFGNLIGDVVVPNTEQAQTARKVLVIEDLDVHDKTAKLGAAGAKQARLNIVVCPRHLLHTGSAICLGFFLRAAKYAIFDTNLSLSGPVKMAKRVTLHTSSAKLAVAILAVDNVKVSAFGMNLLKSREDGRMTYEQAREALRLRAQGLALASVA